MNNVYEIRNGPACVWDQGVAVRAAFIVRTYVHLFAAIVGFTLIEVVVFKAGLAETIARPMTSSGLSWLLVLGGFMLVGNVASTAAHTAKSAAAQYAALAVFVALEALIFVPLLWIAGSFYPGVISSAAVVTLIGFSVLTGVALFTRKDFSFLRGLLVWGSTCAMLAIVAAVLFGFTLGPLFSTLMVALAGGFILYRTSEVLHRYPPDRHVAASLELFSAVALMFWYVIRLFMSRD